MGISRRAFLERVGKAGGYGALFVTMTGMGLLAAPQAYAGPPQLPAGSGKGIKVAILGAGIALAYSAHGLSSHPEVLWLVAIAAFVALFAASAMKVADQWDRAVILRLGKFHALQGPGLFFIIPIIEQFATGLILASSRRLSGLKRPSRKTRCLSMWMQSCFGKSSTRKKQHSMWQNIRQP